MFLHVNYLLRFNHKKEKKKEKKLSTTSLVVKKLLLPIKVLRQRQGH